MKILLAAALVCVSVHDASAQRRGGRPFNTANGRTTTSAPQQAPAVTVVTAPGGGVSANSGPAEAAPSGGRAFFGGHSSRETRSVRATRRTSRPFWGGSRGATAPETAPAPAPAEEAPPHFSKPGALIRDTGQAPVYEKAAVGSHTVDAGEIVLNKRKASDVGRGPSVQIGPRDTPPPPNPGNTGSYTGSGAAPNGAAPNGSSGGHDNNGSGNNGKDKPGDDDDAHGGDKAREASFYDAF